MSVVNLPELLVVVASEGPDNSVGPARENNFVSKKSADREDALDHF